MKYLPDPPSTQTVPSSATPPQINEASAWQKKGLLVAKWVIAAGLIGGAVYSLNCDSKENKFIGLMADAVAAVMFSPIFGKNLEP